MTPQSKLFQKWSVDILKNVRLAEALYGQALDKIHRVSPVRHGGHQTFGKYFRSVNIALVNELKVVYEAMGIDVHEVIGAAATSIRLYGISSRSDLAGLYPDRHLTWKAREFGKHTRFIELAGEINTAMPDYVISKVADALNVEGKAIKGSKI